MVHLGGNTAEERCVRYLVISLGGVLGANARYLLGNWVAARYGTSFPYGTMLINVSGSFIIGFFLVLTTERFVVHPNWRLFFAVGFLGAYTTFSTFSFETATLIQDGSWWLGLANIFWSVVLGLVAVLAGMALGRLF
jgi:fluoride exporter